MISRGAVCRLGGIALLAIWIFLMFQPVSAYVVEGIELRREQITPDMLTVEYVGSVRSSGGSPRWLLRTTSLGLPIRWRSGA